MEEDWGFFVEIEKEIYPKQIISIYYDDKEWIQQINYDNKNNNFGKNYLIQTINTIQIVQNYICEIYNYFK